MTAPTEPVKAAPEALTDRLRRGAQFIESTLGDPAVLWSLESRESLAGLLSVAAEALEARDDAAELRAALAAIVGSYVTNKKPHDNLWSLMVRTEVMDRARAALAATEGEEA